mmetsp:Transcript_32769/g.63200  ORF Transcript_32769/g.63200 Transcript_32769/m.63200 type:complete len:101 (+) Transcript_32769:1261-1563(+)
MVCCCNSTAHSASAFPEMHSLEASGERVRRTRFVVRRVMQAGGMFQSRMVAPVRTSSAPTLLEKDSAMTRDSRAMCEQPPNMDAMKAVELWRRVSEMSLS